LNKATIRISAVSHAQITSNNSRLFLFLRSVPWEENLCSSCDNFVFNYSAETWHSCGRGGPSD